MAKGYSLDALVQERWSRYATPLGNGTDINRLSGADNAGIYMVSSNSTAGTINGLPVKMAGVLEVLPWAGPTLSIQRYTVYNTAEEYSRTEDNDTGRWTDWRKKIDVKNVFDTIYPIGIVLQFDNATNPNNMFTGTVWEQIDDGRSARAATSPEVGTTAGQIGSVAGSDTATIAVANLPGHTHGMQNHTHGVAPHSHTMDHNHVITHGHGEAGTNVAGGHTHSLSGTAEGAGQHAHSISQGDNANVPNGRVASSNSRETHVGWTNSDGWHTHPISGTANGAGDHSHVAYIPNFVGSSGGPSAGSTGGTALTTGGPSNNTTTSTGDGAALNVCNSVHYYAFWKRVA